MSKTNPPTVEKAEANLSQPFNADLEYRLQIAHHTNRGLMATCDELGCADPDCGLRRVHAFCRAKSGQHCLYPKCVCTDYAEESRLDCIDLARYLIQRREVILPRLVLKAIEQGVSSDETVADFVRGAHDQVCGCGK